MNSGILGQSAIEYLMTYGWMLLVVAIVGGVIFSVTGDQSVQSTSGFSGQDVLVDDFGLTNEGELQILLRNGGTETVELNALEIETGNTETSAVGLSNQIQVGDTGEVKVEEFAEIGSTNTLQVKINYDIGNLEGLELSGTITAPYEIVSTSQPVETFDYTNQEFDDAYEGAIEDFEISSEKTSFGSKSLLRMGSGVSQIINEDIGPEAGDTFRYQQFVEEPDAFWGSMLFGIQDEDHYYRTMTRPDEDRIRIIKQEGPEHPEDETTIAETEDLELNRDTWYTHEVTWEEDQIILGVFDDTEELVTLEADINGDYNGNTGLGFRVGAGPVYMDNVRILE